MTRATVSDAVNELKNDGIVAEVGVGRSKGGKPPILVSIVDDARCLIGIDLAERDLRGAVINLRGEIKQRLDQRIDGRTGEGALSSVFDLVDRLIPLATSPILGIGIGTPGLVDSRQGIVRDAFNLGWDELRLGEMLDGRYHVPVHVANDSQVAALAEFTFGSAAESPNLVLIKMSRGIGVGLILNRQLYCGDGFGAGELGHVVLVEDGELCRCGHSGCLETVAGSESIIKAARQIARNDPDSALSRYADTPDEIGIDVISSALASGDRALGSRIAEAGRTLGMALAGLVGLLDIRRIVLAGSVTCFGRALLDPIRREIERRSLPAISGGTTVEVTKLGPNIVLLGAAALLLNRELGLP